MSYSRLVPYALPSEGDFFNLCLRGPWHTAGFSVQYAIRVERSVATDNKRVVHVLFQYTASKSDWFFNLLALSFFNTHLGFFLLALSARRSVRKALAGYILGETDERLVFGGFSQGAALATLFAGFAARWKEAPQASLVVFGSPRVFKKKTPPLALFFADAVRYEVGGDPVCALPLLWGEVGRRIQVFAPHRALGPDRHEPDAYREALSNAR